MSGQLLGMHISEIEELFPSIEDFAEIGSYIDQPVRVYSSGMQMRLAFSVATARRPDILIVDEALSVGDTYFQHKSFERIREFRDKGTTLLLVSHDSAAIQSVCDRAILLNNGKVVMQGVPDTVMDYYNAVIAKDTSHTTLQQPGLNGKVETVSGTGEAKIVEACLEDENGAKLKSLRVGQKTRLHVEVELFSDIPELVFGYLIKDRLGQSVYGTNTFNLEKVLHDLKKGERIEFDVIFNANLGEGDYSISLALHTHYTHIMRNYQWKDLSVIFSVVNVENERFIGTCWLPPEIECSRQF
jgi:lipopolysaccharide transport system ATP-binding protein